MNIQNHRSDDLFAWCSPAPLAVAAAALGSAVWIGGLSLAWLALMPAGPCLLRRRREVVAWWLGYYAVALVPVATATHDYLGGAVWAGLAAWAVVLSAQVVAWAWPWAPRYRSGWRRLAGALIGSAIGVLPPLGVVGLAHPLLAAGFLWPGGGFAAVAALYLFWGAMAVLPKRAAAGGLLACLVALTALGCLQEPPSYTDAEVQEVTTRSSPPINWKDLMESAIGLAGRVKGYPDSTVVVFPETAIAEWRPATESLVRQLLLTSPRRGAVVFGTVLDREQPQRRNVAAIVEHGHIRFIEQRQPVPLGMWAPWREDHFGAHWGASSVTHIAGRLVAVHICGEEFFLGLTLLDFALGSPRLIVVLSNLWWSHHPSHDRIQERHTESMAALFGIPYVRAVNRGPTTP